LPANFAFSWPGINLGQQFPPGFFQRGSVFRAGVKAVSLSVAAVKLVDLRPPRVRVPRISVDLLEIDPISQIDEQPPAVGARVKKEVLCRLIILGRNPAVVKLVELSTVRVPLALHDPEFGAGTGLTF